MIPIFLISGWLWGLIAIKMDWLVRVRRNHLGMPEVKDCLKKQKNCVSATPRGLALNQYLKTCNGNWGDDLVADKLLLDAAIRRQAKDIQRYIPTIIILAAVAPLLGLFGTVSGMIETFKVIGLYGMGNAQAMASGIREAMITTQAGLLVAIPGIFIGQIIKKKANSLQHDLLVFQRGILQWLEKEYEI